MAELDTPIWYDGAMNERREALGRIERDALAFLEQSVGDFERDNTPWLLLLDDLDIPIGLDDPADYGYATIRHGYSIEVTGDLIVVSLSVHLPRQLEAAWVALRQQAWCFAPRRHKNSIEMQVRRLDAAKALRIETKFSAEASAVRDRMQRGIATLLSAAAPSPLLRVTEALDEAVRRVEVISATKAERLKRSRDGS